MKSLNELCEHLNNTDYSKIDLHSLPKFGGFKPACSGGVFSWDESNIIVHDGEKFTVEPRGVLDVRTEAKKENIELTVVGDKVYSRSNYSLRAV